jgi:hypothetical protein
LSLNYERRGTKREHDTEEKRRRENEKEREMQTESVALRRLNER